MRIWVMLWHDGRGITTAKDILIIIVTHPCLANALCRILKRLGMFVASKEISWETMRTNSLAPAI